ncbi:MAG: TlpA family protein disulfide reductase [Kofleriaceae bacterium]|jgi:cytochrome c biogenesis protein CcmG/thiol:disulfide interchange protein DsbE|nr:TlpA family protein disulfide reductase [Kofleriaceae bacterium]MBP9170776.1 TlpA family protein disulfide reductase [Kofleriaceae bacterium]MBP9857709.1 TlpA family protein disulfide reductase [Kofleriaceae bacterium]
MSDSPPSHLVDLRKVVATASVLVVVGGLAAGIVWMTPRAAAREVAAACASLESSADNPSLGQIPRPAPDFTVQSHDGRTVKLSDYRGKVVLVNFWASWCNVCKAEKPSLAAATEELTGPGFAVITLASDRSWDDIKKALPKGAPFQVFLDPPPDDDANIGSIAASWGIKAVPESFVIDKQGRIRMYLINKRDWDAPVTQTCLQALIDE